MPIRTNRGRAAVYRRLWGWPLRSPAHLVAAAVGFAVLVTVASVVVPGVTGTRSPAAQRQTGGGATTTPASAGQVGVLPSGPPSSLPTKLPSPTQTPTTVPPDPLATAAAMSWAQAWVDHPEGTTNETWLDGLEPYTSEEMLPQLRSVEPANVPATRVTSIPSVVASFSNRVEVDVTTDGPKLRVTVVKGADGQWVVHQYDEVS
ncbi:hypothetical protein [Umezawaea beigongshangensis]|uniref:hypothetical protein n=1 Tax=Umezawaea beigongshangensis TaxID=2780383 RepID=UPI0018F16C82|nr:hypothetical protein [Umezawaea beigongshangensis]